MNYPVIILAAGGHAEVLIDALRLQSIELLGVVDADPAKKGQSVLGLLVLGADTEIANYPADTVRLVNGLGAIRVGPKRSELFVRFKNGGHQFANVIHPSAVIARDVDLAEGVQIMAGAVIQTGCRIGANAIINTRASVDHHCRIGDHAHIAPGATLCGGVAVGNGAHVGAGATVLQGVQIGSGSLVAAGAVVINDVPDGATVAGIPAREI